MDYILICIYVIWHYLAGEHAHVECFNKDVIYANVLYCAHAPKDNLNYVPLIYL